LQHLPLLAFRRRQRPVERLAADDLLVLGTARDRTGGRLVRIDLMLGDTALDLFPRLRKNIDVAGAAG